MILPMLKFAPVAHASAVPDEIIDERHHRLASNMLNIVSHELRTPLNVIIGFSDLLARENLTQAPHISQYANLINVSGYELLEKINAMLVLARLQSGQFTLTREILNPFDVLKECCDEFLESGEIEVEEGNTSELRLNADRVALKLVLNNLIGNADKFTSSDGEIETMVAARDDGILFTVSDNGCGMSPSSLSMVGAPFVQVDNGCDRQVNGAGLGLAIVKGVVNLHNGKFSLTSRPDVGTTARVRLPIGLNKKHNMFDLV